jgi:ribosome biogenesis GTPase
METEGLVVKVAGSLYSVKDLETGARCDCRLRGKLRLEHARTTNPVAVGDKVTYSLCPDPVIVDIAPRKNYIIRKATNLSKEAHIVASNVDQAVLMATIVEPPTNLEFIDRFLLSAQAYRIPVTLLINKTDLYQPEQRQTAQAWSNVYRNIGYSVVAGSGTDSAFVEQLRATLTGKITLFSGNSGVGKSSMIAALNPLCKVRTGEISGYHHKGKHTTAFSEMFEIAAGAFVIDTPGIKGFGLLDISKDELSHFFPEIFAASKDCRFHNCTHYQEPGCRVRDAVKAGTISPSRYHSYLKILIEDEEKYR